MQVENTALPPRREMVVMRKRPLGETGMDVPWVGLGTSALGYTGTGSLLDSVVNSVKNGIVPDADAIHLIKNALDAESTLIETSPLWGAGRAERLVGQAVNERRSRAIVVTRAGSQQKNGFSADAIRSSLEDSLGRLQSKYVDVLLLDKPGPDVLDGNHEAFQTLSTLKAQGKIRAYGARVDSALLEKAAKNTDSQVLASRFNIFDQSAAASFDTLKAKRIGFLALAPLDSGFLGGRYSKFSFFFDFRQRWNRLEVWRRGELRNKVEALRPALTSLAQLAIQFDLSFDAVSSVVAGARDQHQLIVNTDSGGTEIPQETVEALQKLWMDELKASPLSA